MIEAECEQRRGERVNAANEVVALVFGMRSNKRNLQTREIVRMIVGKDDPCLTEAQSDGENEIIQESIARAEKHMAELAEKEAAAAAAALPAVPVTANG